MEQVNSSDSIRQLKRHMVKLVLVTLFAALYTVLYWWQHYSPTYVPLFEQVVLTDSTLLDRSFSPTKYGDYTLQFLIHGSDKYVPNSRMLFGDSDINVPVDSVGLYVHDIALEATFHRLNDSSDSIKNIQHWHSNLYGSIDSGQLRTYTIESEPIPLRRGEEYRVIVSTVSAPKPLLGIPVALRIRLDGSGPMGRGWMTHAVLGFLIFILFLCCKLTYHWYGVIQDAKRYVRYGIPPST